MPRPRENDATGRILAFRFSRAGLAERSAGPLDSAAAIPISEFVRGSAIQALSARLESVSAGEYEQAIESGRLVLGHLIRGAIHVVEPSLVALLGRALLGRDDAELGPQLGRQVAALLEETGLSPRAALEEVAGATGEALSAGERLDKNALHAALRERVRPELMPWCRGCESHHVAPMLWRYATIAAGARLDSERRYLLADPGPTPPPGAVVGLYLDAYAPGTTADLAEWAGVSKRHARRIWDEAGADLEQVEGPRGPGWVAAEDRAELAEPPAAEGVRMLPPGDPYLQKVNRPLLAADDATRKRLFRPVASPGALIADGRLAGLWRARAKRRGVVIEVERFGRLAKRRIEPEALRLAELRGAEGVELVLD